jgi:DinB superfamily
MRKTVVLLCAVLCFSVVAFGQTLTPEEKEKGIKYLEQTRLGVIDATKDLSAAQWSFKPAPDRWSVAEVVEHMALAEDFLFENGVQRAYKSPAGAPDRDYKKVDAAIMSMVPDRTVHRQAPGPLVPTDKVTGPEALDRFLKSRARNIEFLEKSPGLRGGVADSPLGPMDTYEWLLFISAHCERHTKQLLEVKADPNFPKS